MRIRWTQRTALSPLEAARRITTMEGHRVPFTSIEQVGGSVTAVTTLGPISIVDRMDLGPLDVRGHNVRGTIVKTGPVLGGTLTFAAVRGAERTIIGWEQDLVFLPCRLLDPLLAVIMRIGYGVGFARLLRT